jgi:germination protein M
MFKKGASLLLVLLTLLSIFIGCQPKPEETPYEEIPASQYDAEEPGYRRTVLYFEDEDGYMVPVMKKIKMEEGIGKAALSQLMETAAQSLQASGLYAILPDDAKIDLDVTNKLATLDMNKKAYEAYNALQESNKIIALVNTLTEFSTVDKVQFLVDGQKVSKLEFGTEIGKPISRYVLNPESASEDVDSKSAGKLMLYFGSQQGTHIVPITRYVKGEPDVETAVAEYVKGPVDTMALMNGIPADTKLLEAKLDDKGALSINFSKEFKALMEDAKAEASALKGLYLTCYKFDNVKDVNILVEGEAYEGTAETMAAPVFPNSFQ